MKRNTAKKLNEALANAEQFIRQMEQMDDRKLSKHLDLFHQQLQKAFEQKNEIAYMLLSEYEMQTLEARVNKNFIMGKQG